MIDTSESLAGPRGWIAKCRRSKQVGWRRRPGVGVRPFSEVDLASPAERSGRRGSLVGSAPPLRS
jgi:hypothetical protein